MPRCSLSRSSMISLPSSSFSTSPRSLFSSASYLFNTSSSCFTNFFVSRISPSERMTFERRCCVSISGRATSMDALQFSQRIVCMLQTGLSLGSARICKRTSMGLESQESEIQERPEGLRG
ncbi:hypothetical protein WG66_013783 [Moniliophthora roreri]|nr:hypothetical protein WG66_013783 [Moniliophthora roreri]